MANNKSSNPRNSINNNPRNLNEQYRQSQEKARIKRLRNHLSAKQKLNIVEYALQSEEGYKGIITILYKQFSNKILNFLKVNKTNYCYVHFTFIHGKNHPTIIIDQDQHSYQDMYCIKYIKYIDY